MPSHVHRVHLINPQIYWQDLFAGFIAQTYCVQIDLVEGAEFIYCANVKARDRDDMVMGREIAWEQLLNYEQTIKYLL